ncbi:MAG TPA: 3-keto-5-aminohexanoate cleavage protein, partial [Thermomicrobiales bacterium]|nr:3-keto-5-aminohexanoate cleavage protein [Thermomicrobiales bacterium]
RRGGRDDPDGERQGGGGRITTRARPRGAAPDVAPPAHPVIIEAAINGGRTRSELAAVPIEPAEIAAEAERCVWAGAAAIHLHARDANGGWTADSIRYAETLRRCREAVPGTLLGITSIRPNGVAVDVIVDLLEALAADPATRPDLVSINLGHIVVWEPSGHGANSRRTIHYPNSHDDIAALLAACARLGIVPELGVMDLGFVANAVALRDDGLLPANPWFLLELDNPSWGAGSQVAPSTIGNYDALADALRETVQGAIWAAHGQQLAGYDVLRRALADGQHLRVGVEDATILPDGGAPTSNAELVAWAAGIAAEAHRPVATPAEARAIMGGGY